MSASSFGGSFNLVATNDHKLKNMFMDRLKRAARDIQFPFLKYLPFVPKAQSKEMADVIDGIIAKRRAETGPAKKDLVQTFIDSNDEDPVGFSQMHIQEEMTLFMFVVLHRNVSG